MKIIVTGARGLIGSRLCKSLVSEGHEVWMVSRSPLSDPRGIQWANPETEPFPAGALEGADVVVHLAGEPIAQRRWTDEQRRRIRDSRVVSTRCLLGAFEAMKKRPQALICASAIGFYGDRGDEELFEDSPPGTGFLAETCLEWEAAAREARNLGMRVAVVRIGVVLSKYGGALGSVLGIFRAGLGGSLGSGRQWFPWIHTDDVVGIFRHAILNSGIEGAINAVAPASVTNRQFTKALAETLHRPALFSVPGRFLRLILGDLSELLLSSARVIPRVAERTNYEFRYPELRRALADLLAK